MASATTAIATMAAAGLDKRISSCTSSSLQTPASSTFPSELLSPMAGSPGFLKREECLKTPITPPSAYLDFLKNISPAIQSPASTSTSARFSFHDKSFDSTNSDKTSESLGGGPKSSITPPTSHPSLSRNTSYDSNASTGSDKTTVTNSSATVKSGKSRPDSPRIVIPPSSFAKPAPRSARTPRRLHIPQSPFSPAHSASSPYSATPLSAAPWSASFSPRDYSAADANGQPGKVHVRQVVTRTVTYCRTPLDPAPKGKRRKLRHDDTASSKLSSDEPAIKQERIEKIEEVSEPHTSNQETSS